jgi:hypothetical protein
MGSGYRVFTAGEVLSASNVQNYLQDQAVMVFGGTAARSSAIGTANFEEGMLTYLTDVDKLQVYTGAAFADVYPAAATNQGLTLINTTSFSAVASQSINNVFSATYQNYRIVVNFVCSTNTALNIRLRVGGVDNSGASAYSLQSAQFSSTASSIARATGAQWAGFDAPDIRNGISFDLFNPFEALVTTGSSVNLYFDSASIANQIQGLYHNVASSFDGFSFFPSSGTITGEVSVYGYNK